MASLRSQISEKFAGFAMFQQRFNVVADLLLLLFFVLFYLYPNATIVLLFADLQIYSITVTAKNVNVPACCNNM
jgi:hypothetical protein